MKPLPFLTSAFSFILGILVYFSLPAIAAENPTSLKIATWNIENLRPNSNKDFRQLQDYAELLDADVIALQEVDGVEAVSKVFDEDDYQFFFSRRNHPQRTGFAVRQGIRVEQNPDYEELDVGDVRHGTDITVQVGEDQAIRMLSVHLKSGCFERDLTGSVRGGCIKLKQQLPILEEWIDQRAQAEIPFVVMGDFNRRFNQINDDFWQEIDDGNPVNADLIKVTENRLSTCFDGQYPDYIDHIVLDQITSQWWDHSSFEQVNYNQPLSRQDLLSDHCAIAVSLNIPTTPSEPSPQEPSRTELLERIRNAIEELKAIESMLETD